MKTRFILYGGFDPNQTNPDNASFSKEILKEALESANVLIVPFAKEADRIIPTTDRVASELNANKWQKLINIEVANEKNFLQQLKVADVVYFQGGASLKLLETLKNYPNLESFLDGKIVAGDSAGANVLASFFYSPSSDEVFSGLGILPIKIIPHYKEEYKGKLDDSGFTLEAFLLPEYTFKSFCKE